MEIRLIKSGEQAAASVLANRVFDEFVDDGFTEEGTAQFKSYADPQAIADRWQQDHFALVAVEGVEVVGLLEVRKCSHVSLLFVDPAWHGQGVAKKLFHAALERINELGRMPDLLTVNSSKYAVPIYKSLGFEPRGEELMFRGILHVPMVFEV